MCVRHFITSHSLNPVFIYAVYLDAKENKTCKLLALTAKVAFPVAW